MPLELDELRTRLGAALRMSGKTKADVIRETSLSSTTVHNIFGGRNYPTADNLASVLECLGADANQVLGLAKPSPLVKLSPADETALRVGRSIAEMPLAVRRRLAAIAQVLMDEHRGDALPGMKDWMPPGSTATEGTRSKKARAARKAKTG